ncbi:MFS transporter [Aerococcus agrisoli]|uniref:MFS transporter n=2 Tax=Aerococcus agrisoli TaxID=2487350 RepID=A0A3N4GCA2_9LACT|nr:MFS transporter [Aerococcus agrisoli]
MRNLRQLYNIKEHIMEKINEKNLQTADVTKPLNKSQRNALIAAIVASGTDDLNVMFLAFSMSSIIADLAISSVAAGWIATITNFGMLAGGLVFGVLADRYSKMKVFYLTILTFSIATALIFFTPNIQYLYLLRFIAGIGVGGEYGVAISIMAGLVPSKQLGRISSLNGIVGQIGSITSALLAGFIVPALGWRGLFLFGLLPILVVVWAKLTIKEDELGINTDEVVEDAAAEEIVGAKPAISDLFKTPALTYQTIILMVMTTVQIAGYFGMMNWLPTIMQEQVGVTVSGSSSWMITTILGMCLGMLTFGQILDRIGPRLAYGSYLIASAIAVYLFTFANSGAAILIGGAIVGFFVNGMFAGYGAMISRLYPFKINAIANNTILNVGRAVGGFSSVIIGYILDVSSVSMVMIFLSSLYIISFIAMMSLKQLKRANFEQHQLHIQHKVND